eukprot:9070226-Alexandrium_andersonii.AAC.1
MRWATARLGGCRADGGCGTFAAAASPLASMQTMAAHMLLVMLFLLVRPHAARCIGARMWVHCTVRMLNVA